MTERLTLKARDIAKMIDHSLLRPEMTEDEVVAECKTAQEFKVATVCVRPYDVALCKSLLLNSEVLISAVVGFPHGNSTIEAKIFEAQRAMDDGASELDVVLPIGKVRSGAWDYVEKEISSVVEVAHARQVLVKIIFENHYLTDAEIIKCCQLCEKLGVDFVKTSTGYAPTGATVERVKLMRANCSPRVGVKAAGGIRNLDQFLELMAAGATRQGTRSTKEIMAEALKREREGILKLPVI